MIGIAAPSGRPPDSGLNRRRAPAGEVGDHGQSRRVVLYSRPRQGKIPDGLKNTHYCP